MYAIARGPLVWVAFLLFFAGLAVEFLRFSRITREKPAVFPLAGARPGAPKAQKESITVRMSCYANSAAAQVRPSIFGTHPVMTVVTVLFHALLFFIPVALLAHNVLWDGSWGFSLPSISDATADGLTLIVLGCLAVFLYRRLFVARVRAISKAQDYFVWLVTAAPFVTGFLAYHQVGDYQSMILAHILTGELMLVCIPFTRLGHALFFFLYRFLLNGEYSFGRGRRIWSGRSSAGEGA